MDARFFSKENNSGQNYKYAASHKCTYILEKWLYLFKILSDHYKFRKIHTIYLLERESTWAKFNHAKLPYLYLSSHGIYVHVCSLFVLYLHDY